MDRFLRFILIALTLFSSLNTIQAESHDTPQTTIKASVSSREKGRQLMAALVERFRNDMEAKKLKESETRSQYIDEFWQCLGWDMVNEAQAELYQQESIHESRIFVGNRNLYIDYKQVAGDHVFMVEAKRVRVDIDKPEFVYQAKRYSWSSMRSELAVLTNFKSLRVYDTRHMPQYDAPRQGELAAFRLDYTEYPAKFDLLYDTFSREAVLKGSLSKMLDKIDPKKSRISIDVALIGHMDKLRLQMAQGLIDENPGISAHEINTAVHNMLNRILFARIIEDRDIESSGVLRNLIMTWRGDKLITDGHTQRPQSKESLHSLLVQTFTGRLRERYKGIVFNHHPGDKLKFSDAVLADTIMSLYPQDTENPKGCSYDFAVVPVGIIGKIYESYLGKRIFVKNGKARLELTPSVRQAGGIFYTPDMAAYYMAKRTLKPLISGKSPEEIMKLRIVDPALGCGALLIQAQRVIFEEIRNFYTLHPDKIGNRDSEFPDAIIREDGSVKLSPVLKAKLVGETLYGVDIDSQAIEIASMWLYIGILQNENHSLSDQERRWKMPHRANHSSPHFELPDLSRNLVNGNSLVEPDYQGDDRADVQPFDWRDNPTRIATVMKAGGFNACLGNPPYQGYRKMVEHIPEQLKYLREKYQSLSYRQGDLSFAFVERGIQILKPGGRMGYILTNRFLFNDSAMPLRNILRDRRLVQEIVNFNSARIFDEASVYTALLFIEATDNPYFMYANLLAPGAANEMLEALDSEDKETENTKFFISKVNYKTLSDSHWSFPPPSFKEDFAAMGTQKFKLGDIAKGFKGIDTGLNTVFILEVLEADGDFYEVSSKFLNRTLKLEKAALRPIAFGRDVKQFAVFQAKNYVICPYDQQNRLIPEETLKKEFPLVYEYLLSCKEALSKRRSAKEWYAWTTPRNFPLVAKPKLLVVLNNQSAIDISGGVFHTGGLISAVSLTDKNISPWMLMGILNSKPVREYTRNSAAAYGGRSSVTSGILERIPIPEFNERTAPVYLEIESLAKEISELHATGKNTVSHETRLNELVKELYQQGTKSTVKKAAFRSEAPVWSAYQPTLILET